AEVIEHDHTTKSGKTRTVNLRDRLFDLEVISNVSDSSEAAQTEASAPQVTLRYVGSCRNDGTLLRSNQVVYMLEQLAQHELQLLRIHRNRLFLAHEGNSQELVKLI
ncbi:MAG TPA: B12-binding domain-containing radical SAM protein, partial [Elainellaceae cyanobacterium]